MNHTQPEKPMDSETMKAAIEAQMLMGHWVPSPHMAGDGTTITDWSWDVDQVRQVLHVPCNALWDQRVLELEAQGLASFCMDAPPVTWDEDGNESLIPGWEDEPREEWGSVSIHPRGVLRLAELYGRPYVKLEESPALLAHWRLVQAETEARLHAPDDEARWAREYPEKAALWQVHLEELRRQWEQE